MRANEWSRGTTLNGFAGVATDSSRAAPVLGGAIGWEITPRFAIEGDGSWLEFGDGMSAFAGSLNVRARLSGLRTVDPFVQGGIGLYRASFASDARRAPEFYHRRMRGPFVAGGAAATFTDPTVVAGGGVTFFVNRHLAIRPDAAATIVLRHRGHYV